MGGVGRRGQEVGGVERSGQEVGGVGRKGEEVDMVGRRGEEVGEGMLRESSWMVWSCLLQRGDPLE